MTLLTIYDNSAGVVFESLDGQQPRTFHIGSSEHEQFLDEIKQRCYALDTEHQSWSVEPSSPYVVPEHGPILAMYLGPRSDARNRAPQTILDLARTPGYSLVWHAVRRRPRRTWSKQAIGRNRRKRLRERLEAKYPLFAEAWIAAELSRDPERYYPEYYQQEATA